MASAERAFDIIELLSAAPAGIRASVIVRRTGIPRSSAYAALSVLEQRGFANRDSDGRWTLSDKLAALSTGSPDLGDLIAVLEAFRGSGDSSEDLSTIARRTRQHVTTVRHALDALVDEAMVTAHEDGRYSVGLRLATLTAGLGALDEIRAVVAPVLEDLRDSTGETANLMALDDDYVVYVDQIESRRALRHSGWTGRRIPAGTSASGQAINKSKPVIARDSVEAGVTAVAQRLPVDLPMALSVTGPSSRLVGVELDYVSAKLDEACRRVDHRARTLLPRRRS